MTASELARVLHAQKHGGYYMARCPAHPDKRPSLSIRDQDGKVRLHCFVGCEAKAIISALGLTFRDLGFASDPKWKQRIKASAMKPCGPRKRLGLIEAIYPYTGIHGELVAEKIRFEGKVFLWRRPQAGGGWIWKVDRENLPLYRLHQISQASHVCVVEGEKDADNLAKLLKYGWAATTAPNGAKSWRKEFVEHLRGKKIFVIPDFDEPGRVYATSIANQLSEVATAVRVLSVAPSKDVSAYLAEHTPADLSTLFRRALLWKPRRAV